MLLFLTKKSSKSAFLLAGQDLREACDLRVVTSYVITFGASCVIDHPRECSNQTLARNYGCYYYYTFSFT